MVGVTLKIATPIFKRPAREGTDTPPKEIHASIINTTHIKGGLEDHAAYRAALVLIPLPVLPSSLGDGGGDEARYLGDLRVQAQQILCAQ